MVPSLKLIRATLSGNNLISSNLSNSNQKWKLIVLFNQLGKRLNTKKRILNFVLNLFSWNYQVWFCLRRWWKNFIKNTTSKTIIQTHRREDEKDMASTVNNIGAKLCQEMCMNQESSTNFIFVNEHRDRKSYCLANRIIFQN